MNAVLTHINKILVRENSNLLNEMNSLRDKESVSMNAVSVPEEQPTTTEEKDNE